MSKELERKFLIKTDEWKSLYTYSYEIRQGYLNKNTRIRIVDFNKAYLTIKNDCLSIRNEFEYEIPRLDGIEIYNGMCKKYIIKTRYIIPFKSHKIEVDVYKEKMWNNLIVAEIEYNYRAEMYSLKLPDWIQKSKEITFVKKYQNYNLAKVIL